MKKEMIFLGVMLVFLFGLTNFAAADSVALNVSLTNYDPLPAQPGEYVDIWIKVENIGADDAPDAKIILDPAYPFSIERGYDTSKDFGIIGTNYGEVVKFTLRVDKDVVQGTNKLYYNLTVDAAHGPWIRGSFTIDVETGNANLAVVEVKSEPEQINPGGSAKVSIKVKNMADAPLKDVNVKLDFSAVRTVTATLYDLPFAPIGSTSEQRVYKINPGETRLFEFTVMAYPGAEANLYKIPIEITYSDDVGNDYTKQDMIGLVVNSAPELAASVDEVGVNTVGQTGDLVLKFVNRGLTEIKFLTVTIGDSDGFELLSTTNEVYIGNIDSDDYETAEYTIKLSKTGEIDIPITVQFKDATNKVFEQSTTLKTTVRSAQDMGTAKNSTAAVITWIVIIVVIVLVVWWVRRRRKKKRV